MAPRSSIARNELEEAAFNGELEHAQALLKQNRASVNARASDQSTPIMWAARRGHVSMVEELIAAGADPSLANQAGETAVDIAAATQQHDIVAMLEIKRLENYAYNRDLAEKRFTGSFFGCSKATKIKWANVAIKIIKEYLSLRKDNQIGQDISLSAYLHNNQHRLNARALKQGELGAIFSSILNRDTNYLGINIRPRK